MAKHQLTLDGAYSSQGHGSRACYTSGCREPQCKAANAAYMRDYRNGARGTYTNRMGPYRLGDTHPRYGKGHPLAV